MYLNRHNIKQTTFTKFTLACSVYIYVNKIYKYKLHHVYYIHSQDLQK